MICSYSVESLQSHPSGSLPGRWHNRQVVPRTEDILSYSGILSSVLLALQQRSSLGLAGESFWKEAPLWDIWQQLIL